MIYIEKGEINTFALTLNEVTTIVDPYSVYESPVQIIVDENTTTNGLNLIETGRLVVAGGSISSIYD